MPRLQRGIEFTRKANKWYNYLYDDTRRRERHGRRRGKVISHAVNLSSMKTALLAALRLFYSMGYRSGYADAMNDAKPWKDRCVIAHLN